MDHDSSSNANTTTQSQSEEDQRPEHAFVPKSSDPTWRWAYCTSKDNLNAVTCARCKRVLNGGIYRAKQHLLGIGTNARICGNSNAEIRGVLHAYMEEQKGKKLTKGNRQPRSYVAVDDGVEIQVNTSTSEFGSRQPRQKGPMDVFLHQGTSTAKQTTLENRYKKEERQLVCQSISRWFYQAGIPFNTVNLPSFQVMINDIRQFGPGMKGPSYHEMRGPLLATEVARTDEFVKLYKEHWKKYGCSIMSDGWTDTRGRTLINFLAHCPIRTLFMKSVDASDKVKDANLLFTLLREVIKEVGEDNVVQIVTDNASNYIKAGKMLMDDPELQHLYWTPCAAHCLDLMLEDIGDISEFKRIFAQARQLVVFIYAHGETLNMMRTFTQRDLHRPAVTRFATRFLTLESLHKSKKGLRTMFTSNEWSTSKLAKTVSGKQSDRTVLQQRFWRGVTKELKVMHPLVSVLRMVDSDEKPSMCLIYEAMDRAKEKIKVNLKHDQSSYQPIWDVIDKRWEDQLHQPLHAAGLYLNPGLFYDYPDVESNFEIMDGLFKCISRLTRSPIDQSNIHDQMVAYRKAEGPFGMHMAIEKRKTLLPIDWWTSYGIGCLDLQKFAIRVLGLTCSASSCERNWSTFERLHTKKRNRLQHKKLNDLVYVSYNQRLRERHEERKRLGYQIDPIVLREVDDNEEWPSDEDNVYDDDPSPTWDIVDSAIGASQGNDGPSTRSNKKKKKKHDVPTSKGKRKLIEIQGTQEEEEETNYDDTDEDDMSIPYDDDSDNISTSSSSSTSHGHHYS